MKKILFSFVLLALVLSIFEIRLVQSAPQTPSSSSELRNLLDPDTNPSGDYDWHYWWDEAVPGNQTYFTWFFDEIIPSQEKIFAMFWDKAVPYNWTDGFYFRALWDRSVPDYWTNGYYFRTFWDKAVPSNWAYGYYNKRLWGSSVNDRWTYGYYQDKLRFRAIPNNWARSYYKNWGKYYVITNVTYNFEYLMYGNPDRKTGVSLKRFSVGTGKHENIWNPGGWWYWGATPTGKWKIISKEKTSGVFGPWFLRLTYLSSPGKYVNSYALHGTNEPSSIGEWVSSGCVRHHNHEIEYLKSILGVGTVVWTVK